MIRTTLYNHQQEAVDKLSKVKVGALFMDMGTGKTLTALKLFDLRLKDNKVNKLIYLCPISSKNNVEQEIEKHTDFKYGMHFEIFGIDSISQSDRIYYEVFNKVDNKTMLVVDESTYIKNPLALRTKRALELGKKTEYKLIMTGTPITKFVKDLWAQIMFLSPLIFGYRSYNSFANNHLVYHKRKKYIIRSANVDYLTQKMSPYVFEINIEDIKDMPSKSYNFEYYTLGWDLTKKYENKKRKLLEQMFEEEESWKNKTIIYQLFTELQKIIAYDKDRLKVLDRIMEKLNPERQAIIWTKYIRERNDIMEFLKKKNETYSIFDGEFKQEKEFKNKKTRFLIANLQTGSHAQNFQNCNYQIFYANSFDYATRLQAERRIWREGQDRKCIYYDIKSNAGIEDLIFKSLSKKSSLLNDFKKLSARFNKKYLEEYFKKELSISGKNIREDISRKKCF